MTPIEIFKEFRFEASHILPRHPGKCSRLHGHSWRLKISVLGYINPETGFVLDYAILKDLVKTHILDVVDHQHLGQGRVGCGDQIFDPPFGTAFYPSSENLVLAFSRILLPLIPEAEAGWTPELVSRLFGGLTYGSPGWQPRLQRIELDETCTSTAVWKNLERSFHLWKR